jgi:hypothetical protein
VLRFSYIEKAISYQLISVSLYVKKEADDSRVLQVQTLVGPFFTLFLEGNHYSRVAQNAMRLVPLEGGAEVKLNRH